MFFECLICGWVRPEYRDENVEWAIYSDGTVTMHDK
jgi:hypothetical protein